MKIFAILIKSHYSGNIIEGKDISICGSLTLSHCKKFNESDFAHGMKYIDDFYFYLKRDDNFSYVFVCDFRINEAMVKLQFSDLATIAKTTSQDDLNQKIRDSAYTPSSPKPNKKPKPKKSSCFCWFKTDEEMTSTQENASLLKAKR